MTNAVASPEAGRIVRSPKARPARKLQWNEALIGGGDGKPATCKPEKFSFFGGGLELTYPRRPRSNDDLAVEQTT